MVTAETELGCFGMSICYDVRFPELYRLLAIKGARVLFVPVSFTKETGEEHLEMLLRARAVENGCYVIAAAQTGVKPAYTAYGNSMLIDPWGKVLVRAGSETGVFFMGRSIWIMPMRSAAGCRPWKAGGRTCTRWKKK